VPFRTDYLSIAGSTNCQAVPGAACGVPGVRAGCEVLGAVPGVECEMPGADEGLFAAFHVCWQTWRPAFSQNETTDSESHHRGLRCELNHANAEPHAKGAGHDEGTIVGLAIHSETIAVAFAEAGGEVQALGMIPNQPESIRKLLKTLGPAEHLRVCYEAGPTGYVIDWQLTGLGIR
jgi:hypothetical protein